MKSVVIRLSHEGGLAYTQQISVDMQGAHTPIDRAEKIYDHFEIMLDKFLTYMEEQKRA
jgi:hypothetical protein|tara:strand:+ start:106 stop:282 length:177 start_codon:yes stop_codon:yes gene_type:complete